MTDYIILRKEKEKIKMLGIRKDVNNIVKAIKETDKEEWDLVLILLMGVLILLPIVKVLLMTIALGYAYCLMGLEGATCVACGIIISSVISSRKN